MHGRPKIAVVTSICGDKDHLLENHVMGSAQWIAYVEGPATSRMWEVRPAYSHFKSPRRNARIVKLLIHQFADADFSIWIDGNQRLHKPPEELVERFLGDYDLAAFKHPLRDCLYGEAEDCAMKKLDDPGVIEEQARKYKGRGFPPNVGQIESMVVLRRHTALVEQFNNAWWSELCRHSVRDQISFSFAAQRTRIRVNYIPENQYEWIDGRFLRGRFLERVEHLTPQPEPYYD